MIRPLVVSILRIKLINLRARMSKEFESSTLHTNCRADFDFLSETQIISVGHDKLLYVFDTVLKERVSNSELDVEMNSIAVHPANRRVFAMGGHSNVLHTFENQELIGGTLIQKFQGHVHRICYSQNGRYLATASEEDTLNIFDQDLQTNVKCRPSHDGMTLNACFDPLGRYVISLGCEGQAVIFQLSETPQMLRKYKISKDVSPSGIQILQADWHPSGTWVALPGQLNLQLIKVDGDPEDLISTYLVSHAREISLVCWANPAALITVGLDKIVKLWHFKNEKDIDLVWQTQLPENIVQLRITPSRSTLFLLDAIGNLHWTQLDCDDLKLSTKVKESKKKYNEIYSNTQNALQDLIQRKVQQPTEMIDEEELEVEEKEVIDHKIDPVKTKPQKTQKENDIIDMRPQNTLLSTKTESSRFNDRRFLLQNFVGSVKATSYAQDDKTFRSIEVEFFDRIYSMIKLDNEHHFEMAAMNYRALILASKGPNNRDPDEEGYVNDQEPSRIYCENLHIEIEANKFVLELPNQEGAEALAIGNDWFAVATDAGIVHIMSLSGLEMVTFTLTKPLVALAAYEYLLVVAYLDSPPIYGCQMIKANIYDIQQGKKVEEIEVSLSLYSTLEWFGFSEDGLLISKDSSKFIWGYLFDQTRWVQINCGQTNGNRFWLYAASEYKLIGFLLDADTEYPDASATPLPEMLDYTISFVGCVDAVAEKSKEISMLEFKMAHEQYRVKKFAHLTDARTRKSNPLSKYSESIWEQERFVATEKQINKLRLYIIRDLFQLLEYEKLIEYFKTHVKQQQLINTVVSFIEQKAQVPKLVDRIKQIQQEKVRILMYQGQPADNSSTLVQDLKPQQEQGSISYGLKRPMQTLNLNVQTSQATQEPRVQLESIKHSQQQDKLVEEHIPPQVKYEEKPRNNPFAKTEVNTTQNIFEHLELQQENNRKRKAMSAASQMQFGQSTLVAKKK